MLPSNSRFFLTLRVGKTIVNSIVQKKRIWFGDFRIQLSSLKKPQVLVNINYRNFHEGFSFFLGSFKSPYGIPTSYWKKTFLVHIYQLSLAKVCLSCMSLKCAWLKKTCYIYCSYSIYQKGIVLFQI